MPSCLVSEQIALSSVRDLCLHVSASVVWSLFLSAVLNMQHWHDFESNNTLCVGHIGRPHWTTSTTNKCVVVKQKTCFLFVYAPSELSWPSTRGRRPLLNERPSAQAMGLAADIQSAPVFSPTRYFRFGPALIRPVVQLQWWFNIVAVLPANDNDISQYITWRKYRIFFATTFMILCVWALHY